jgi:hypothetical protein
MKPVYPWNATPIQITGAWFGPSANCLPPPLPILGRLIWPQETFFCETTSKNHVSTHLPWTLDKMRVSTVAAMVKMKWVGYCPRYAFIQFEIVRGELDRICDLVVRVPGYRSRVPGFDSRRYQIFWEVVGLELRPLSLVRTIEKLLERKVAAPV